MEQKTQSDFLLEQAGIESTDESVGEIFPDITEPFDPKAINISMETHTINGIVTRLREKEINLDTDFQRKGNLWTPDVQSRLIESLMLRFPLPAFYFDAESEDSWLVVDGLQRLWTLNNFVIEQQLTLRGLEILSQYENYKFSDLPRPMQRRIQETQITAHIIKPGTPRPVKYNIFKRINTGGFQLNFMEIRHALNQGPAANFLKEISENAEFKQYVKVSDKRMADRELILRYVAFYLISYKEYVYPLNKFLDKAIEKLAKLNDSQRSDLKNSLLLALKVSQGWFGNRQFSRSLDDDNKRVLLNQALFEVWTSQLSKLSHKQLKNIQKNISEFVEEYRTILKSEAFNNALSRATTVPTSVNVRFDAIDNLLKKYGS